MPSSCPAATGIVTLRPPTNSHSFKKILEDKLAALLGAGYRSRTSRLEKKRFSTGTAQQRDGGGRRWRGTFLQLSEMEKGEIGKSDGDGGASDTGDFGTPLQVKQAQPSLSPRGLTPLEQKRALRLEMLTRMIEEFHAKHGRRHRGGAKRSRNKVVGLRGPAAPTSATAADPGGQNHDLVREGATAAAGTAGGTDEITPLHICVCCGGEGGRGHGRRCEHVFRRCGFCRVDEVKRVLGIRDPHGRAEGDEHALVNDGRASGAFDAREEAQKEEDEFEWVTDSEEDDPEFQCDSCGRVIEETADRFHCEVCGDHDSCQACFFSSRKAANGQQDLQEGRAGGEHLASHDVTRIMGKPALPDR
ncbi:unnamed protein product [Scytosiphon promiscuus]